MDLRTPDEDNASTGHGPSHGAGNGTAASSTENAVPNPRITQPSPKPTLLEAAKAVSLYVANRRAGPVTPQAINRKYPHLTEKEILSALHEAYKNGRVTSLNFINSIERCRKKLQKLADIPDDFYDNAFNERKRTRIEEATKRLERLERQQGAFRRVQQHPDRPLTLIEFIASCGGIKGSWRNNRNNGASRLTQSQPMLPMFDGRFGTPDEEHTSRDSDAYEVFCFIDGGPILISMFGALIFSGGRLNFDQAAEAALQGGFYPPDQYGNGVDNEAFKTLLRQDYEAWRSKDWRQRVFSQHDINAAYNFFESLEDAQARHEVISRYGMPLMGEDCSEWRKHIRELHISTASKGVTQAHLQYVAFRLGLDHDTTEKMTMRELVAEVQYGLDCNDDERPLREVAVLMVAEAALGAHSKQYRQLAESYEAKRRSEAALDDIPFDDIPFDIEPPKRSRKHANAASSTGPEDCPF